MYEVSKSIAYITGIMVIDGQVKKIDMKPMIFGNFLKKHILSVFVWDVADHQSSSTIAFDLNNRNITILGIMRYYWTYSPEIVRLFLCWTCGCKK